MSRTGDFAAWTYWFLESSCGDSIHDMQPASQLMLWLCRCLFFLCYLNWAEQIKCQICMKKMLEGFFWKYGTVNYFHSVRVNRDLLCSLNLTGQWRWQNAYRLIENNCHSLICRTELVALVCRGVFRNCFSSRPWNFANACAKLVREMFSQVRSD